MDREEQLEQQRVQELYLQHLVTLTAAIKIADGALDRESTDPQQTVNEANDLLVAASKTVITAWKLPS